MIVGEDIDKFLKHFFSKAPAQAFLLMGQTTDLETLLIRYLACEKKSFCKKCPGCESDSVFDLHIFEEDTLAIEDARAIQWKANQSSFGGAKIFLIKNKYIAPDAESTLLKTIEEPYQNTYFILSSVSESALSRPLLSRLTVLMRAGSDDSSASKFKFTLEDALLSSQERSETENIFNTMELWAEEKLKRTPAHNFGQITNFIEDLYELKRRFFEKTYSPRMLLEHLAISRYYIEL